jgi:hypothetical protein
VSLVRFRAPYIYIYNYEYIYADLSRPMPLGPLTNTVDQTGIVRVVKRDGALAHFQRSSDPPAERRAWGRPHIDGEQIPALHAAEPGCSTSLRKTRNYRRQHSCSDSGSSHTVEEQKTADAPSLLSLSLLSPSLLSPSLALSQLQSTLLNN